MSFRDATVRGGFELDASQPIRDLTTIRDRGREANTTLGQLGSTLDHIGGPTTTQRLEQVKTKISAIGTVATTTVNKVDTEFGRMETSIDRHATAIEGRLDRLEIKLRDVGRITATPTVNLNGVAEANLQLSELERRLAALNRQRASPRVGIGGGFSNIAGGGGGGGGISSMAGGAGGRPPTLFSAVGGLPTMALAGLGLLPGAMGLLGGATALAGSAGSAALGAGTVGLGGLGPLAIGGALTYASVKPALSGLDQIIKQQQKYTQAVQDFGKASTQAATAKRAYDAALVNTPAAAGAARQIGLFQQDYRRAFAPAANAFYSGVSNVAYAARAGLPSWGRSGAIATTATAGAATSFTQFLTQPQQLATVRTLVNAFASELPTAERSLENFATTLGHLAVAAIPFFHEANVWVEHWSAGMARSSGDTVKVRSTMQGLVNDAKDWAHLAGAGGGLLKDIFSAGAPSGTSMVVQFTHTLDRWDRFIRDNPQKVQAFFHQAESTVGHIANAIGGVARLISNIGQILTPIFNRGMDLVNLVSSLGPGGLPLLYGAYQGVRGALGGGGPSAARAAGGFLTGSPMAFLGGRGGGTTVVGGGAALAGATSSTGAFAPRSYMMAPSGFQTGTRLPSSAIGQQMPLFAALAGGGIIGSRAASSALAARGEVAFNQAYGGIAGARFAPLEVGASRAYGLSRLAGPLGGAASGAARFLGPAALITGILQAAQTSGGLPHRIGAGLSTAASTLTLGAVSPSQFGGVFHSAFGTDNAGASLSGVGGQSVRNLVAASANVRTPQQLQTLTERVKFQLGPGSAEFSPADQAKIQAAMRGVLSTAATNAGAQASNTWQDAFTRSLDRGTRPNKAVGTMLAGMNTQIRALGPQGGRAFAKDVATWATQMEADNPRMRRPMQRLMQGVVDDVNRMNHDVGNSVKDLRDKIFFFNGQIFQGTDQTWGAIRDSLTNKAQVAQEKLAGIWGQIQSEAINALTQMGFSKSQAKDIVTQTGRGGGFAAAAATQVGAKAHAGVTVSPGGAFSPHARGGMLGGTGLLDSVHLGNGEVAAPGETWIANRHTMNALSSATVEKYGKTAWEMIRDEGRPHSAPMRRHAFGGSIAGALSRSNANANNTAGQGGPGGTGGYVYPLPGFTLGRTDMGVDANAAPGTPILALGDSRLASVLQGWYAGQPLLDFQLTSGPKAGSYWYVAEQISPVTEQIGATFRAGQAVARYASSGTGIEIGWGAPGGQTLAQATTGYHEGQVTSAGSSFAAFIAGLSHGRLVGGGPGAGGVGPGGAPRSVNLKAPRSGLPGMPGALVDQASKVLTAGMQRHVNAKLGAGSTPGGGGIVPGSATGSIMSIAQQAALAEGVPWDANIVSTLLQKESGGGQNLPPHNYGGILDPAGPFQVISGTFSQYAVPGHNNRMNPYDNALAAMNYIHHRYGSLQGLASATGLMGSGYHGYSRGGQAKWAGWHARGTSGVTNGPTMFGAGEGGRRERVTIGPATSHTGRGGGHTIIVKMEHVELSAHPAQIEKIGREVAGKILEAIDSADAGPTDQELLN